MANDVLISDNGEAAYMPGIAAVVTTNGGAKSAPKPTVPPVSDEKSMRDGKLVPWGDNNQFPQTVLKECRKNTIIGSALDQKARIAYEAGLAYGTRDVVNGEIVRTEILDDRVEAFRRRSKLNRYLIKGYRDFYWFYNVFPELITNLGKTEIISIKAQPASYCRWGKPSEKAPVDRCFISADWENENTDGSGDYTTKPIKAIDIYDAINSIKNATNDFKFIYPVSYPTEDESFYSLVDWNSVRESGWLAVMQAIPEFKKNLFENQLNIKFHIQISNHYWEKMYPGFWNKKQNERDVIMAKVLKSMEDKLKGTANSGGSIMSIYEISPAGDKEFPGWKITPIDDKIKSDVYIGDSNEASSHLLFALGLDPTLIGSQPGSKLGAGSGSDKRVAFNIYSDLILAHQELVLEPLNFIAEFNGWKTADGKQIEFWMRNLRNKEEPASNNAMTEAQQQAS